MVSDNEGGSGARPAATFRRVYFVSDHTGVTAEVLGHSLLARFDHLDIDTATRPFVNTAERAEALVDEFAKLASAPIVFSTITDPALRSRISEVAVLHLDLFEPFMAQLEATLGQRAETRVGAAHGIRDLTRHRLVVRQLYRVAALPRGHRIEPRLIP